MGDRNNPIKFGPEWLRNLAREQSAGSAASSAQNAAVSGTASPGATASASGGASNSASLGLTAKVLLAKLRYGREEMLALYDKTSEAPQELKHIDLLYQPRGKPPVALNNTFDDEMRESMRTGPPIGATSPGERFGIGRGMGRPNVVEGRGRGARMPFVRQPSLGRGGGTWQIGGNNTRMPGYVGVVGDEESPPNLRSWSNSNGGGGGGSSTVRNAGDQSEWTANKMFRNKRPGTNSNWRQSTRDDSEEWRASDANRARSTQQDKWERDWGERPNQENKPSWNPNRRTWVGGDAQNDDNLPEWAIDGAEACGGTFDSSGAFHGYSNDDTNLPKTQDTAYALTRSHTHGSFARSKTMEEGSEEWWASEKAKKLSPKRFDASDIKFKKPSSGISDGTASTSVNTKQNTNEEVATNKGLDKPESSSAVAPEPPEHSSSLEDAFNKKTVRFTESKRFEAMMRAHIKMEEANDERGGNFQSVMINPNNSLRQKHQNIVASASSGSNRQNRKSGLLQLSSNPSAESELTKQLQTPEERIVENLMDMALEDKEEILHTLPSSESPLIDLSPSGMQSAIPTHNPMSQMAIPVMQMRISSPALSNQGMTMGSKQSLPAGLQPTSMQAPGIQTVGITNSALNASLGLPLGPSNNTMPMGIPLPGVPPPVLPTQGMTNPGMGLQTGTGISGFPSSGGMPGMSSANMANNSLFLGQNSNNPSLHSTAEIPMPSHGNQPNMFPIHGLQHSGSQGAFGSSIYGNIMQPPAAPTNANPQSLADQWYYEDPKKNIQGPFTSKDMFNWYRAGFFSPSLMVRRACDGLMRPLGSYGPVVPFAQMDMMSTYRGPHDSMLNPQQGLRLDVDSLWSPSSPSPDLMWMQQAMNARNENRVSNMSMFFWDQQPSAIASNSMLPEEITKEMKTEDQILAQLRASQNINTTQNLNFFNEPPPALPTTAKKPDDLLAPNVNVTPNLEELQKLMQEETLKDHPAVVGDSEDKKEPQTRVDNTLKVEKNAADLNVDKTQQQDTNKVSNVIKQAKVENEKSVKNKENGNIKVKSKKGKEDKKEGSAESLNKEEDSSGTEKRSQESSPVKSKKDEKLNKKEIEKEKKEWIKEGFTIVKGSEKIPNKDNKKKAEEAKAAEDADKKRREEERLVAEEEKRSRHAEALKKQQEIQQQHQQRQVAESMMKKAPWSAVTNQSMQATNKDGLNLAEIQRLEREKKLEQIKEQQQMMHIIAQQHAASLAREQEVQAGLGWAKKKGANVNNAQSQGLAEIQAEARMQAAAAVVAAAQVFEDVQISQPPPQMNHVPWGNSHNGGGFWDSPPSQILTPSLMQAPIQGPIQASTQAPTQSPAQSATQASKQPESPKVDPNKNKKKITPINLSMKKEISPAAEFEGWCTTVLASWSAKIDVPTFVGFLKDIESPYEVKDYVKCYLGETKDSSDFARQFLERRSKLLRVGMVTPSDDLCSPAMAINPRTTSGSDYQEVKGKGKKTKKNKMLKVDARILGFSVTAAEDRINVGDIDSV